MLPSGVIAMAEGLVPTVMAGPAVPVAIVIGVTVPDADPVPATYAVFPFGVIAIALGYPLSAIAACTHC